MTRILTVTSWYPPHHYGGYELSCFDVMKRFVERGHDVRILCGDERLPGAAPADPDHERLVYRDLRPHMWEGSTRRPSLRERLAIERHNRRTLHRHLAEHDPDVVSVWHIPAISLGLVREVEDQELPVVYVVCDDWPAYGEKLDAWMSLFNGGMLRAAVGRAVEAATGLPTSLGDFGIQGAHCFVSESTRGRVTSGRPAPYPRSTVVYSGVERALFPHRRTARERSWGWRLLYVGRFDAAKGVETLLRSLPHLPPAATVECYGRGGLEQRARLAGLADDLQVSGRVSFGSLEREELAARYEAADALVFPSEWEEPFGLVPIEAMACGTPVVATGVGGSAEFLRDGYNCVLFSAADAGALVAAVRRLETDPDLRDRVRRGGFLTADQLDADHLADTLEQWHVAAADGFSSGRPPDRHLDLPSPGEQTSSEPDPSAAPARPARPAAIPPQLADHLAEGMSGVVLSVGAAHSAIARRSAGRRGRTTVVVENDIQRTRDFAARTRTAAAQVAGVVADGPRLPFPDGTFDAVVCDGAIALTEDDALFVHELARVLRHRGAAVLATLNRGDARRTRARLDDRLHGRECTGDAWLHSNDGRREYTWREFERLVGRDFRILARHAVGWHRGRKSRLASALIRVAPLRRFSRAIVLEARRW